jgi:predicted nucleic acid-binding Zn finger protein
MTAKEIQKRNVKSNQLKVMQSEDGQFFVESSKGKILYNVTLNGTDKSCTCGDFAKNHKNDAAFVCKHILAVENSVPENEIESTKFLKKNTPKLKDGFLKNIKGKDFVLYAGVLDLATQKGLLKLEVELLQYPTKENGNEAICRATAEGKNGEVFSDIGDANPNNCTPMIAKHLIRMASTRSKGRCLRDMCDIGIACLEELESIDDVVGSGSAKKTTRKPATPKAKPAAAAKKVTEKKEPEKASKPGNAPKKVNNSKAKESKVSKQEQGTPSFSEAQKRAIFNLSRRRGISVESLDNLVMEDYGKTLDDLSSAEASDLIRSLQQAA